MLLISQFYGTPWATNNFIFSSDFLCFPFLYFLRSLPLKKKALFLISKFANICAFFRRMCRVQTSLQEKVQILFGRLQWRAMILRTRWGEDDLEELFEHFDYLKVVRNKNESIVANCVYFLIGIWWKLIIIW